MGTGIDYIVNDPYPSNVYDISYPPRIPFCVSNRSCQMELTDAAILVGKGTQDWSNLAPAHTQYALGGSLITSPGCR